LIRTENRSTILKRLATTLQI